LQPSGAPPAQGPWKPLIVCPHAGLSSRIRLAFTELGIIEVNHLAEYPRIGSLNSVASERGCNICLIDVASNSEHALLLAAECSPGIPVVALNTRNDADLILRCLRRGACEFLADPTPEQLRAVMERLSRLRSPLEQPKPSTVYCVVPGKPGCGASTLAAHLAIEIKRSGAARVLLVDTDVQAGAIAFLLKLKPDFHLGDAIRDRGRLDADLWSRLAVPCHGIDVLLAPDNPAAPVEISRQIAMELLAFWRGHYDAIVLDTAGAQAGAAELARLSGEILLVTTNELVALHATRRSIEYLEQNAIERSGLRLIVNRYTPATGLKRDEVETALKLEPFALLANEYELVQEAVLEGRPMASNSRFGRSIHALAGRLIGKTAPARKRSAWFGLLPSRS